MSMCLFSIIFYCCYSIKFNSKMYFQMQGGALIHCVVFQCTNLIHILSFLRVNIIFQNYLDNNLCNILSKFIAATMLIDSTSTNSELNVSFLYNFFALLYCLGFLYIPRAPPCKQLVVQSCTSKL